VHVSESILSQLLSIVKDETVLTEVSQLAFQLLYHITKVIGILLQLIENELAFAKIRCA